MGCHGDHMLWQVDNGSEPKHQGPHQETVKHREIRHARVLSLFMGGENKLTLSVSVCVCVSAKLYLMCYPVYACM